MVLLSGMPPQVSAAFSIYRDMGRRSLKLLQGELPRTRSIATLKRWSAKYNWQDQVAVHDRQMFEQSRAISNEARVERTMAELKTIRVLQDRFYDRLIDPNDPTITPKQRRRALKSVSVREFCTLLKVEMELVRGFAKPRAPSDSPAQERYTNEEMRAMMRALAQVRHGLPPESLKR
jgi:hypothetical protein